MNCENNTAINRVSCNRKTQALNDGCTVSQTAFKLAEELGYNAIEQEQAYPHLFNDRLEQ